MTCISCDKKHNENYCPRCGEKSDTLKITFSTIFNGAFSTLTNMDKGFLYNLKWLLLDPKKITIDYIRGKRKSIFNPISFLVISITLYIITETVFKAPSDLPPQSIDSVKSLGAAIGRICIQLLRLKYFILLTPFVLASSIHLIFKKYNYWENVATSAFIVGMSALASIAFHLIVRAPLLTNPILYLAVLILTYAVFKDENRILRTLFSSFLVVLLFAVQLLIFTLLTAIIYNFKDFVDQLF